MTTTEFDDAEIGTGANRTGLYLAVLIGRVFCTFLPIIHFLLCYDKPSDTHLTTRHDDMNESWRAVQSSALIDGEVGLHPGSAESVAAHLSMGMTEQHHRHSGVVHRTL
jgi:hypothetical protein